MSNTLDTIIGLAMLVFIFFFIFSILFELFSTKPTKRRSRSRRSTSTYRYRGQKYNYYGTKRVAYRNPRKYSGKSYITNPDPDTFMVGSPTGTDLCTVCRNP